MAHDLTGRPILCVVTDRQRLCPGAGVADGCRAVVAQVEAAVRAGIDMVQIRERDLDARTLLRLVLDSVEAANGSATAVVVNDRTDVALSAGAHGVHLRERSAPASAVRAIAGRALIVGRSLHAASDDGVLPRSGLQRPGAIDVDYGILGPVFPTRSKPSGVPFLGLDGFSALAKRIAAPVLAIGGVSENRASALARAGAAGVAGIDLWLPGAGKNPGEELSARATAIRLAWRAEGAG